SLAGDPCSRPRDKVCNNDRRGEVRDEHQDHRSRRRAERLADTDLPHAPAGDERCHPKQAESTHGHCDDSQRSECEAYAAKRRIRASEEIVDKVAINCYAGRKARPGGIDTFDRGGKILAPYPHCYLVLGPDAQAIEHALADRQAERVRLNDSNNLYRLRTDV